MLGIAMDFSKDKSFVLSSLTLSCCCSIIVKGLLLLFALEKMKY